MTNLLWVVEWTVVVACLFTAVFAIVLFVSLGLYEVGEWRRRTQAGRRAGVFGRDWRDL